MQQQCIIGYQTTPKKMTKGAFGSLQGVQPGPGEKKAHWLESRAASKTWPTCDGAVLRHPVGNPKRKVWGAQQQVSLSCETKVIELVGESQTSEGDAC
jgi:hypothetical protein